MVVVDADKYKQKTNKVVTLPTVSGTVWVRVDGCVGVQMRWRADVDDSKEKQKEKRKKRILTKYKY